MDRAANLLVNKHKETLQTLKKRDGKYKHYFYVGPQGAQTKTEVEFAKWNGENRAEVLVFCKELVRFERECVANGWTNRHLFSATAKLFTEDKVSSQAWTQVLTDPAHPWHADAGRTTANWSLAIREWVIKISKKAYEGDAIIDDIDKQFKYESTRCDVMQDQLMEPQKFHAKIMDLFDVTRKFIPTTTAVPANNSREALKIVYKLYGDDMRWWLEDLKAIDPFNQNPAWDAEDLSDKYQNYYAEYLNFKGARPKRRPKPQFKSAACNDSSASSGNNGNGGGGHGNGGAGQGSGGGGKRSGGGLQRSNKKSRQSQGQGQGQGQGRNQTNSAGGRMCTLPGHNHLRSECRADPASRQFSIACCKSTLRNSDCPSWYKNVCRKWGIIDDTQTCRVVSDTPREPPPRGQPPSQDRGQAPRQDQRGNNYRRDYYRRGDDRRPAAASSAMVLYDRDQDQRPADAAVTLQSLQAALHAYPQLQQQLRQDPRQAIAPSAAEPQEANPFSSHQAQEGQGQWMFHPRRS